MAPAAAANRARNLHIAKPLRISPRARARRGWWWIADFGVRRSVVRPAARAVEIDGPRIRAFRQFCLGARAALRHPLRSPPVPHPRSSQCEAALVPADPARGT